MVSDEVMKETKKKLEEHDKRIQELERIVSGKIKEERYKASKSSEEVKKLAEKIKIPKENIKEVFDLEKNSLTLVKITGQNDREKTKNATLLILLGYKYFFGQEGVLSKEIRRNIAENRIPLNNFSTYLHEITPSLIRRKGKLKSPKTTYRLVPFGEAEAKQLLKELCKR